MIVSAIVTIAGTLFSVLFIVVVLKGKKYAELVAPLDSKDFPLKDVYVAGFALFDMMKFEYTGKLAWRLRDEANILYGEKYAAYYMRIVMAQSVSLGLLVLAVGFSFSNLIGPQDQLLMVFLTVVLAAIIMYYFTDVMKTKITKQNERYASQFPEIVSKLALLINSGMMLREAWENVANSSDEELYMLMRTVAEDVRNGQSEADAYYHFGLLCGVQEIRKFISMLIQNLSKGNADLAIMLGQQSTELWEVRRQQVLQKGELAASKLMIPIGLMFVGILIIVVVPILGNMGMI